MRMFGTRARWHLISSHNTLAELRSGELVDGAVTEPVPPSIRRLNLIAGWGMAALIFSGFVSVVASDFVPSHLTVQLTKIASILVGLFCGVFFLGVGHFGWDKANPKVRAAMQQSPRLAHAYVRVPLMAGVLAGFTWMSFSNVLPWAATAVIGRRGTMTVIVDGWQGEFYSRSGRSCAKPTLRGVPFMMMGRYALCVGDQYKQSDFPPGTSLVLIGRVSLLGVMPDHYRVVSRG